MQSSNFNRIATSQEKDIYLSHVLYLLEKCSFVVHSDMSNLIGEIRSGADPIKMLLPTCKTHAELSGLELHDILSITEQIDAKVVAVTELYTVPSDKTAIITALIFRVHSADSVLVAPRIGCGIAVNEDDIMPATNMTGLSSTGSFYKYNTTGIVALGTADSIINLGIDTGATASELLINVDLIGYLI